MDIISLIGMVLAVGFILFGILTSGSILTFVDIPSILIVIGGTAGALLLSARKKNAMQFVKCFGIVFKEKGKNEVEIINGLVEWSTKARKGGLLALEEEIPKIEDKFIKTGLMMIIDGSEPETIKRVLSIKLKGTVERHSSNRGLMDTGASLAPAFGMVGTLIGLVNMLKSLSDPSTIGPQMSVALITTFYGSLIANVVFLPMSKKLKSKTTAEIYQKEMIIEGLMSIQAGENPNTIKTKLMAFYNDKENEAIDAKVNSQE
ncbi:motility protein A [Clostridium tagluense]|uniref:Motility protein A n=1 Tax=Clostridium tagluense TaxID=360422 RepID=A0A401US28_9CLOT|nr:MULTISPECIES: motility protein A [Clostridium]MBU3127750.1 motility protein A [Clostridium tagluense]MBW9158916.1 motility protein A [Clostridium tagluense]MBZ9624884.1 motility protein A [Clostridium sp. FP2]MCB2313935.1 motility protein A [Clostridium tagluense]MCB2318752.1 motility protein A [Clostridium tagluense]